MPLNQDIARWWLRNARIRHGHVPDITDDLSGKGGGLLPAAILAAVTALGGGAVGAALGSMLSESPAIVAPEAKGSGSLYQYLEDHNQHLP